MRAEIARVNPKLLQHLNALDPEGKKSVVIAEYPFGCDLLRAGNIQLPSDNQQLYPIQDKAIPNDIARALHYGKIPIGIVLDKSIEVFYETQQRVFADKLWKAGTIFGIWEFFEHQPTHDSAQLSNLSAGARSLFMLQKISDYVSHERLRKTFALQKPAPRTTRDHRDSFAELIHNHHLGNQWRCRILYLTKDWLAPHPAQAAFHAFLLNTAWEQSYNCRRQFEFNLSWEEILNRISHEGLYLSPRLSSHIKQLYLITEGIFPGMVFATEQDEHIAPIKLIQQCYQETYRLKAAPLLMYPSHIKPNKPVYYSLNSSNYFETTLPTKSKARLMDELRLLQTTLATVNQKCQGLPAATYTYYHTKPNGHTDIHTPLHLLQHDVKVSTSLQHADTLPLNSTFFNGCIKIDLA